MFFFSAGEQKPAGNFFKTGTHPYSWPSPTHEVSSDPNRPTYGSKEGNYDLGSGGFCPNGFSRSQLTLAFPVPLPFLSYVPLKWGSGNTFRKFSYTLFLILLYSTVGAVVQLIEYRTRNQEVAGSTHTRFTGSNLEQVANLLCAQANSASYPQRDGKWVVATATGWRSSVAD